MDRVLVHGIPQECAVNHVLKLPDAPEIEGVVEKDGYYYLRFREAGHYSFKFQARKYHVDVSPRVSVRLPRKKRRKERVKDPMMALRSQFGTCKMESAVLYCKTSGW